jgi:hypothetical protein
MKKIMAIWKDREKLQKDRAAFTRGTQVIYLPSHVHENVNDPDAELGFIMAVNMDEKVAFVRYFWNPDKVKGHSDLRTTANSERTDFCYLYPYLHHDQNEIDDLVEKLEEEMVNQRVYRLLQTPMG